MALSARNHLKGEVTEVLLGTVTALITVKVGAKVVESVITKLARPSGYSRSAATSTPNSHSARRNWPRYPVRKSTLVTSTEPQPSMKAYPHWKSFSVPVLRWARSCAGRT